jgi:hypothetical protein
MTPSYKLNRLYLGDRKFSSQRKYKTIKLKLKIAKLFFWLVVIFFIFLLFFESIVLKLTFLGAMFITLITIVCLYAGWFDLIVLKLSRKLNASKVKYTAIR